MKKIKNTVIGFSLIFGFASLLNSCIEPVDLMTADVHTGGMVIVDKTFPYKLNATPSFDVTVKVPVGPAVTSVEVFKSFENKVDTLTSNKVSLTILNIDGANETAEVTKTLTLDYATLAQDLTFDGYELPDLEGELNIGDAWTLEYVSTMADGREVSQSKTTIVSVANFFAGSYDTEMRYFHPTAGGSHPSFGAAFDPDDPYGGIRNEEKDLTAVSADRCVTTFGVWSDLAWIIIDPIDYTVGYEVDDTWGYDVLTGDPFDASHVPAYDSETGVISLYYYYSGSGGDRIFWEIFTPAE